MLDTIIVTEQKEILSQRRNRNSAPLTQIFRQMRHGGPCVRRREIDFKSIAGTEYGSLLNDTVVAANFGRSGLPFGLGNSELFSDFDLGVMNGESDNMDLEPSSRGLESLL